MTTEYNRLYNIKIKDEKKIPATASYLSGQNVCFLAPQKAQMAEVVATKIGIGVDASNNILDVSGNSVFTGRVDVSGNLFLNGTAIGTGIPLDVSNNFVWKTGNVNESINGVKTFTSVPECSTEATTNNQLVNYARLINHVNNNAVLTQGAVSQSITGVKTFSARVICSNANIGQSNSDLINITYANTRYAQMAVSNTFTQPNTITFNTTDISVQNYLWFDGSGNIPANRTTTTMVSDVKNQTITIQGWTMVGTAISSITGYYALWANGSLNGYNNYGANPTPASTYYCIFGAYSSGSTPSNSTFYVEAPPTLSAGMYQASWYSNVRNGTTYTTTSLNVSLSGGATLLSYNDIDTRQQAGTWKQRSIIFEVKTSARLRWTFLDSQSTSNRLYAFCIGSLVITNYSGLKINDQTNSSYLTGSLAQLNNVSMNGSNQIIGSLQMTGIPNFYTARGNQNVGISTSFTAQTGSTASSNNIVIGDAGFYATAYSRNVLIGNGLLGEASLGQGTLSDSCIIGNNIVKANLKDVYIGSNLRASDPIGRNICIGADQFFVSTSTTPLYKSIFLGTNMGQGFFYGGSNTPLLENVVLGHDAMKDGVLTPAYTTAVGNGCMRWVNGTNTTNIYNTAIGFESGYDPLGSTNTSYREPYRYSTLIGSRTHTGGNIGNIEYATALGYGASSDASYCCVIGAGATYATPNTIRLGRAEDKTIVSSLYDIGNADISGNLVVEGSTDLNATIVSSMKNEGNEDISGNLVVDGSITGNSNTFLKTTKIKGGDLTIVNADETFSIKTYLTSSNGIEFKNVAITAKSNSKYYMYDTTDVLRGEWTESKLQLNSSSFQQNDMKLGESGGSITGATTITKPYNQVRPVESTSTAFTITLPTITEDDLGHEILFRKVKQGGTAQTISFIGNGTQKIYDLTSLTGSTSAVGLMTSSVYVVRLCALLDTTTGGAYAWFQTQ